MECAWRSVESAMTFPALDNHRNRLIRGCSAMAERRTEGVEILERGDIFFLYRPRVDEDDPSRLSDTQRFFIVLRPERERKLRLLVVGRKRLPNVEGHERTWGFV